MTYYKGVGLLSLILTEVLVTILLQRPLVFALFFRTFHTQNGMVTININDKTTANGTIHNDGDAVGRGDIRLVLLYKMTLKINWWIKYCCLWLYRWYLFIARIFTLYSELKWCYLEKDTRCGHVGTETNTDLNWIWLPVNPTKWLCCLTFDIIEMKDIEIL